jgi:hypothetical protein
VTGQAGRVADRAAAACPVVVEATLVGKVRINTMCGKYLARRAAESGNSVVLIVESLEQTKAGLRFKARKTERAHAVTRPARSLGTT